MYRTLFFIFLLLLGKEAVLQEVPTFRKNISHTLQQRLTKASARDSLDVVLVVKNIDSVQNREQVRVLASYKPAGVILIRAERNVLHKLLSVDFTGFADLAIPAKEELTTASLDLGTNKINFAHHVFSQITGDGIHASIKEQQFDTADIDLKGRHFSSGVAASTISTHATIMATALAGGGNTSQQAIGAAPGALLTSSSFSPVLPDEDSVYRKYAISVQNHSYGTVIENFYGAQAVAFDVSAHNNSSLLHVFSSGNSGTGTSSSGPYAGIASFATLTGNFKQLKNGIVVGATDSFYAVSALSSRGPAYDGRVKPELVAFGVDGSSGAAALVSGTAALLQQAYKELHGRLPSSFLVKAVLINSARDVGPKGIDFVSGYGSLDAYKSIRTISRQQWFEDSVASGVSKEFSIQVPQNMAQLKVSLVWLDKPASVNASKALVNDLDLTVRLSNTEEKWLPWVLNPFPNRDSLVLSPVRTRDSINNIEQVTIDHPKEGRYQIEVKGTYVENEKQPFAIAYSFDSSSVFYFTYPNKGEALSSDGQKVVRWETSLSGQGSLYYSSDSTTWIKISDTLSLEKGYATWQAPNANGEVKLKMIIPSLGERASESFLLSSVPDLQVGFNCADSFMLYWSPARASRYQLYQLGSRYMEPFAVVQDTFLIIKKESSSSPYYSVAPLLSGKAGVRSSTINYKAHGADCYLRSFYLQTQTESKVEFMSQLSTLYEVRQLVLQKLTQSGYTTVAQIMHPLSQTNLFSDNNLKSGLNTYRLQVQLNNGGVVFSEPITVYHFINSSVIVYPNPVQQGQPINLITNEAGRTRVQFISSSGVLLKELPLREVLVQVPSSQFSKGVYFVRIINEEGKVQVQKIMVY